MDKKLIGSFGEKIAINYLLQNNHKIIIRNYRKKWGEIDIVSYDNKTKETVFLEVKTISLSNSQLLPEEELTNEKLIRLKRVILSFLNQYHLEDKPWRFDFIAIEIPSFHLKPKIRHYQDVFLDFE